MVSQESSAHYSKIPIDGQRFLSVRFVPNTIKLAFASAKGFLNYELRITNYEFGRRPLNPNFHIRKLPHQPSTGAMVTLATLSYFSSTVTTPSTGVTVEEVVVPSAAVTVTV